MEGVGAMVEHQLGIVVGLSSGLDAQVAEHGVGFPTAEELDSVFVNSSTEKSGSSTWAERTSANELGVNTSDVLEVLGRDPEGFGDVGGLDGVPALVIAMAVVVFIERWLYREWPCCVGGARQGGLEL